MDKLFVESIAIGHGDCTLVRWQPDGDDEFCMVVDGGPRSGTQHALEAHGVKRADLMVLTHVDADHVDGLVQLADELEVGTYWGPCLPAFESI